MSNGESSSGSDALHEHTEKFERANNHVYVLQSEENPEFVLVFVHGLLLEESEREHAFWSTWKMRNSNDCWPVTLLPKYLDKKKRKDWEPYRIRVLAVSYDSRTSVPDVELEGTDEVLLSEVFIKDLVGSGICRGGEDGETDVPIILIGHDLGGILIKLFIMAVAKRAIYPGGDMEERFLLNLKSVIFYATPHNGSRAIEEMAKKIQDNAPNRMLQLMRVLGSALARVNGDFTRYRSGKSEGLKQPRFKTYAVVPLHKTDQKGFHKEMVVAEASARHDVDHYYSVTADHFQVCQAQALWDYCMTNLGDQIHEVMKKIREEEALFQGLKDFASKQGESSIQASLRQGIPQLSEAHIL